MTNDIVSGIAAAITKMENANPALNNPGNIMDIAHWKATYDPATQVGDFKLQQYDTPEQGQAALQSLITKYIGQGLTLNDFFAKYAPAGHGANNPTAYANYVSSQTGIPTDVPLDTLAVAASPAAPPIPTALSSDSSSSDYSNNAGSSLLSLFGSVGSGSTDALEVSSGVMQASIDPTVWLGVGALALVLIMVAKR